MSRLMILLAVTLGCAVAGCNAVGIRSHATSVFDIGTVHRSISTTSAEAQLWFDRGLAMAYGFNHEEAIACYQRALEYDPNCAMAYWGQAHAMGPNYNNPLPEEPANRTAHEMLQHALARLDHVSPVERALIRALELRCSSNPAADRNELDRAYAEAMRLVRSAHADDADVAALTAEALMQVIPWALWSREGLAAAETPEILEVLESALDKWPNHPALCHFYIHAVEASPNPERGLEAARRLETLVPGAGHLVHMPSHIYVWTGLYDDVVRVNQEAVERDRAFVEYAGRVNMYTLYRLHNYHFVAYGSMWEGRYQTAIDAARDLVREIPDELLTQIPDFLDIFTATPYHVMVRFGRWEDILAEPEPAGVLFAARAVRRYARAVAFASLGRVPEARREQAAFLRAKAAVPVTRLLFNNTVASILNVGESFLAGEIEYRAGNHDRAFELLREAVSLDEQLQYDEPWGWMEPVRHALGALLTEQGRYAEAESVYRKNLERYPNNGWALHGLAECLRGLGRHDEATEVDDRFRVAWARADVEISGSCFCKGVAASP